MSRWPRKPLPALAWGLDGAHVAWRTSASAHATPELDTHASGFDRALAGLRAGHPVDLVAANDLALHWLQTPPTAVRSLAELKTVAAARCAQLFGGAPHDWHVGGDWNATTPFPCAAMPRALVEPLQAQLARHKVRAQWHTTWGLVCHHMAHRLPADGWVALRSPRRVILWHNRAGLAQQLVTRVVDPEADARQVASETLAQLQVERCRTDNTADGPLHWLDLDASQAVINMPGVKPVALPSAPAARATTIEAVAALNLHTVATGVCR